MNRVLVMRSLRDSWFLLAGCAALVFGFIWLRVWVASKIRGEAFIRLFSEGLKVFSDLLPVPIEDLASPIGRAAFSYEELPVVLLLALWTVTRGSECMVGRVGAGTMEMLLAQPLRRLTLVTSHTAVTVAGIAALGAASWLGLGAGLATSHYDPPPPWKAMLPAAGSYICLGVFFLGFATAASALARTRSQAVAAFIAFYVIELAIMIIARLSPNAQWLKYLTITTAYAPTKQTLDLSRDFAAHWSMYWQQNAVLAGLGLAMGLIGTIVFCRRDLPAPL